MPRDLWDFGPGRELMTRVGVLHRCQFGGLAFSEMAACNRDRNFLGVCLRDLWLCIPASRPVYRCRLICQMCRRTNSAKVVPLQYTYVTAAALSNADPHHRSPLAAKLICLTVLTEWSRINLTF